MKSQINYRRWLLGTLVLTVLYSLVLLSSIWFIWKYPTSSWVIPVGTIPIACIAGTLVFALSAFRKMDELLQRIHLEALAYAFFATLVLAMGYDFLSLAGVKLTANGLSGTIMIVFWVLGLAIGMIRYKAY